MRGFLCDPAGIRTQGPYIKSVLLYQLSYGIIPDWECKYIMNILFYNASEKFFHFKYSTF